MEQRQLAARSGHVNIITAHGRVVLALMLRDIQTRMGSSYVGFLFGLILPLGHISVVTGIYVLMGRRSPIGADVVLFLSTEVVPFVIWSYTHQRMLQALAQNLSLTAFPIVKTIDIFVARAAVELLSSALICIVCLIALATYGNDMFVSDPPLLLLAALLAYALGAATGLFFGLMGHFSPTLGLLGFLIIPVFWLTSGVLFIPDALPRGPATLPLVFCHCPCHRRGTHGSLPRLRQFPSSLGFVLGAIALNSLASLFIMRVFRAELTGH